LKKNGFNKILLKKTGLISINQNKIGCFILMLRPLFYVLAWL
jgi:hypothetical protein